MLTDLNDANLLITQQASLLKAANREIETLRIQLNGSYTVRNNMKEIIVEQRAKIQQLLNQVTNIQQHVKELNTQVAEYIAAEAI